MTNVGCVGNRGRPCMNHLLASSVYLVMHNKGQMILAVYWAKKHNVLDTY